jgi:hypothetical protein
MRVGAVVAALPGKIRMDTALGTAIENDQAPYITYPLASARLEASIVFPKFLRARTNPRYNCHGLTFGSRRTAILSDAEITTILQEDGYSPVVDRKDVLPGDVVVYFAADGTIEHSAVVASRPLAPFYVPEVFSKWGPGGPELLHAATDCPYAVGDLRYYRVMP